MPPESASRIDEAFTRSVVDRLREGKPIRRSLPGSGRIHVDRMLPFLFLYRKPVRQSDVGTDRLILGEAAYILAPGTRNYVPGLSMLIQAIGEACTRKFGGFLLIEVSATPSDDSLGNLKLPAPHFLVRHRGAPALASTIEKFEESLRRIRLRRMPAEVDSVVDAIVSPRGMAPVVSESSLSIRGVHALGLEVRPIYRSDEGTFPLVLRDLRREVSKSMKRALVSFVRTETRDKPAHYQALGRRAVVKATWEVDRILSEVNAEFDFILAVSPVNVRRARRRFERQYEEKAPRFDYRPLRLTPIQLKRKLYSAPLERIEDPELGWIFRQKQQELDRQLSALEDRDSSKFLLWSMLLHGSVDSALLEAATTLLDRIPPHSREGRGTKKVSAQAFADRARKEIGHFIEKYPKAQASVEITNGVTGLMVSRGTLLISSDLSVPSSRVEALIQHEVGTHILTYINGKSQRFHLLDAGLAGYDELQEGLAVLAEYLVGGLSAPRLRLLAARVVAVKNMIDGATFVDTFRQLDRSYEFSKDTAFSITTRVYRGGGLTKDAAYLRGLIRVLKYLRAGGSIESLLVGKLGADDVPVIDELLRRKVLHPPPLRPRYLEDPAARARLQALSQAENTELRPLDLLVDATTRNRKRRRK